MEEAAFTLGPAGKVFDDNSLSAVVVSVVSIVVIVVCRVAMIIDDIAAVTLILPSKLFVIVVIGVVVIVFVDVDVVEENDDWSGMVCGTLRPRNASVALHRRRLKS